MGLARNNDQWSWGIATERFVILQVWKDEQIPKMRAFPVLRGHQRQTDLGRCSRGLFERLRHLDEISAGKACYLQVLWVDEEVLSNTGVRKIKKFNKQSLLVSDGKLIEQENGDILVRFHDRILIDQFVAANRTSESKQISVLGGKSSI